MATNKAAYYAAMVSLGGFVFGFDASVISGVVGFIVPEFGLDDLDVGLVVGAPTLAGIISGLAAGPISDFVGRKKVLIALGALYTASAVLSALAPNYETLVFARFLGGFAFASLGIAPMYIAEIAPSERRGFLVSFNQFNIVIGLSIAYFANLFFVLASQSDAGWVRALGIDRYTWRWMLGLEAIPAALWLGFLFTIPESPRWLGIRGRLDEARAVLASLRPPERIESTLDEIRHSASEARISFVNRVRALFVPSMKLPIAIGIVIGIAQQVTGVNAIFFYAPRIFEQSGVGTNAAFAQAVVVGIINVVFTIVAMLLIDRLGRRPLLLAGLTGVILSTGLAGYGFSQASYSLDAPTVAALPDTVDRDALESLIGQSFEDDRAFKRALASAIGAEQVRQYEADLIEAGIDVNPVIILVGILGFVASFAVSLGPVMWVLFSEIFPNRIRGIAMAFVGVFNSTSSFFVQYLFPWEVSNLGSATTFYIYSALGVVGLVILARLLPETKGKSLEQLEADFGRKAAAA